MPSTASARRSSKLDPMEHLSPTALARVTAGFPREIASKLSAWPVTDAGPLVSDIAMEPVTVCGEEVRIPYGVCFGAPELSDAQSPLEKAMIHCVYTRHHDGYRREAHVEQVLLSPSVWAAPYLMRLLGAPVVQIIERIESGLTDAWVGQLRDFAGENEDFMRLTRARARSYWWFYRHQFRTVEDYPALRILSRLED